MYTFTCFLISPVGQEVKFSARIQLLVSKLGRSSKPSPRFIIVVRVIEAFTNAKLINVRDRRPKPFIS